MATKPTRNRRTRPADDGADPANSSAEIRQPLAPTVGPGAAARHVGRCAAECGSSELRAGLHGLARVTRRGAGSARRAVALAAAVAGVLDEAGHAGPDRWLVAEAAAWGLARLARSRRQAIASAGSHLERLVAEALAGRDLLADRDTRPARFLIVLSRLFVDVEACRDFEAAARAAVAEEIGRLVSDDGAVVLSGSTAVVERVCRWSGVRAVARDLGAPGWDGDVDRRFAAAAAAALRLLGDRGRWLADGGLLPAATTATFLASLAETGGRRVCRTARLVRRGGAARGIRRLLRTDLHDAAAATTIIRSGWERDAVRVLLDYRDAVPRLEIAAGDRLLVDGPWEWGTSTAGRPLDAEGAWAVVGWESGRKAAFLEIAAPLGGGMRLERQVVVLRRQRIVLLADAVVPTDAAAGEIVHRAAVRLAPGLEAEAAGETREVLAYDGAMRFMALPLALNEWRSVGRGGLDATDGKLVLEQAGHWRLLAPLWIDCDPRRVGRPLTWRQLTVADTRRILPPHQATGFRVQAGTDQWLLYRALDVPRNRTVLGCNVSGGFLLGRVRRSGEVARTVEIE